MAGSISGIIGALIQALYGLIMKALKLTDRTFIDFSEVFIMGKDFKGSLAVVAGVLTHLILGAVWGVGFVIFIRLASPRHYYFRAIAYGVLLWLSLGIIGSGFNLPLFKEIPPGPLLETFGGGIVFGVANAFILRLLERKTDLA